MFFKSSSYEMNPNQNLPSRSKQNKTRTWRWYYIIPILVISFVIIASETSQWINKATLNGTYYQVIDSENDKNILDDNVFMVISDDESYFSENGIRHNIKIKDSSMYYDSKKFVFSHQGKQIFIYESRSNKDPIEFEKK